MNCSLCGKEFQQKEWQKKAYDFRCIECSRNYQREWRKKRTALGLKCRGKHPKGYFEKYNKEYFQKPEVKKRKAEQMRRYQKDPELRVKHYARASVKRALMYGRMTKKPCEVCGKKVSQAHHEDYSKPLEVIWLCKQHHRAIHANAEGR